jgi:hypothetical protein
VQAAGIVSGGRQQVEEQDVNARFEAPEDLLG